MQERAALLSRIAREIDELPGDRLLVAIDGVDGVGKTHFADELAPLMRSRSVVRASVDHFHNPRDVRYAKGKDSPEGYFADSYNYAQLKKLLLDPVKYRSTPDCHVAYFDHLSDAAAVCDEMTIGERCVLIFDGIFLHRPELAGYWNYSIFLDATRQTTLQRCIDRDGAAGVSSDPEDPIHHRYVRGQQIYVEICDPKRKATHVIDNENFADPKIVL